jgi:hypothetical protein
MTDFKRFLTMDISETTEKRSTARGGPVYEFHLRQQNGFVIITLTVP